MGNSLKIWDDKKISEIWDVISAANSAPKVVTTEASAPKAVTTETSCAQADAEPQSPCKKRKWCGWKQALDDELRSVGGKQQWKKLRDALVARRSEADVG